MASSSKLILVNEALTATNTSATQSLGPRSKKFVAFLLVSVCHADTTVASKIQHSPDGSTWFDLVSFTNIVGTTGNEVKHESAFTVASSAVLGQVRSVVTLSGTTKSATVRVDLCFDDDK